MLVGITLDVWKYFMSHGSWIPEGSGLPSDLGTQVGLLHEGCWTTCGLGKAAGLAQTGYLPPRPPPCPDPENALRQLGRKALEGWTEVGSSPGPQEE